MEDPNRDLETARKELAKRGDDLVHDIYNELRYRMEELTDRISAVPSKSSRQECVAAAEKLIANWPKRESLHLLRLKKLHSHLKTQLQQTSDRKGKEALQKSIQLVREEFNKFNDRQRYLPGFYNEAMTNAVQTALLNLIRGHEDKQTLEWYLDRYIDGRASHVSVSPRVPCPEVKLEQHLAPGSDLSPELLEMVYSYADLESCVALRQVNSAWYSAFQTLDYILRPKVKARNPWMEPGDADMSIKDIPESKNLKKHSACVCLELEKWEKLPSMFTGMSGEFLCSGGTCDHLHLDALPSRYYKFLRDPWTLKVTKDRVAGLLKPNERDMVMKSRGVTFTLPASFILKTSVEDADPPPGPPQGITHAEKYLIVNGQDSVYVLPRNKPHYKHGVRFKRCLSGPYVCGDVFLFVEANGTFAADLEKKKLVKISSDTNKGTERPVAFYNGLFWWHKNTSLVPTLFDLETKQLFYSPDKVITGATEASAKDKFFAQRSGLRNCSQFVTAPHKETLQLVDLARGLVTDIVEPVDSPAPDHIYLGFLYGKFRAYNVFQYQRKELQKEELGIESDAVQSSIFEW
ncbi:hypothetical protein CJU89_4426 [Yarrowia sp. B02]|nr:hypothetical protein CJU89_4426 [Yarrowia sp. B02]